MPTNNLVRRVVLALTVVATLWLPRIGIAEEQVIAAEHSGKSQPRSPTVVLRQRLPQAVVNRPYIGIADLICLDVVVFVPDECLPADWVARFELGEEEAAEFLRIWETRCGENELVPAISGRDTRFLELPLVDLPSCVWLEARAEGRFRLSVHVMQR